MMGKGKGKKEGGVAWFSCPTSPFLLNVPLSPFLPPFFLLFLGASVVNSFSEKSRHQLEPLLRLLHAHGKPFPFSSVSSSLLHPTH